MKKKFKKRIKNITTLIFDVDGVFTDTTLVFGEGEPARIYNLKDGYAITIAKKHGFNLAIISGGKQESIKTRMNSLGIEDVFISTPTDKKLEVFDTYINNKKLTPEEVLYIGDDIPDLLLMQNRNVFSACPKDAVPEVLKHAHYICKNKGGKGAVREIVELILKSQNKWLTKF